MGHEAGQRRREPRTARQTTLARCLRCVARTGLGARGRAGGHPLPGSWKTQGKERGHWCVGNKAGLTEPLRRGPGNGF